MARRGSMTDPIFCAHEESDANFESSWNISVSIAILLTYLPFIRATLWTDISLTADPHG